MDVSEVSIVTDQGILTLENAESQGPGTITWRPGNSWAKLTYGDLVLSGPYTDGPYPHRVKAQYHAHTDQSDGQHTPADVTARYLANGYGSLALTDHDMVTTQPVSVMVPVAGNELSFDTHVLSLNSAYGRGGVDDLQGVLNGISALGGKAVIAHPKLPGYSASVIQMLAATNYLGLEIHNAICMGYLGGSASYAYAVDYWDQLLQSGKVVWGFANDDFHYFTNSVGYDVGRLVVFAKELTVASVVEALVKGNFVADVSNHGVTLNPPTVSFDEVSLSCPGATKIRWITNTGLVRQTAGFEDTYPIQQNEQYLRAEVVGSFAEPFDTPLDSVNRWGVGGNNGGTWFTTLGLLRQNNNSDGEYQLLYKKHREGDFNVTVDFTIPPGGEEQMGIMLNAINHNNFCFVSARKGSTSGLSNTLSFWSRIDGGWSWPPIQVVPFTMQIATWYRMRVIFTAATSEYKARVWKAIDPEPGVWHMTQIQSTFQHGMFGLRCRKRVDFDNLSMDGFKSYYQPIPVASWFGGV